MKAIVIDAPNQIELREVEKPVCRRGDVLIRSAKAGLCRTDLELLRGEVPAEWARYPLIPGHEWSGTVAEVGADVTELTVGDRVVSEGMIPCNRCKRCKDGATNLCENYDQLGFTRGGGCGEYVVAPRHVVQRLPDEISFESAVLVEPAAVVLHVISRVKPVPGEAVGVVGIGTLGSIALQILRLFGPRALIAYGIRQEELEFARAMGATHTVNVAEDDAEGATRRILGEGVDVMVETAGSPEAVKTALNGVRNGGRVGLLGIAGMSARLDIPSDHFVAKDALVVGAFSYTTSIWSKVLGLVNNRQVNLDPIVTHRFAAEDFPRAYELMDNRGTELVAKIVLEHDQMISV
jgi:2-desacetyl-2-hydroxyethyl bacteriochlorophyllide A dehydrogenase